MALIEYHYADAVRLAGHSCPTCAGGWLGARAALRHLYPNEVAERGGISVYLDMLIEHADDPAVVKVRVPA